MTTLYVDVRLHGFSGARDDFDLGRKGSNCGPNYMIQNTLMLLTTAFLSIKGAPYLQRVEDRNRIPGTKIIVDLGTDR